ncbi:MAG: NosD domain-containing protein, partial [Gemmataceae bacterium]
LREAPAATIAPNTSYLLGKQVLRVSKATSVQRIVSDPIAVRPGVHSHAATITPAQGAYPTRLDLTVVDADSMEVLGKGSSQNVERGFSAVAPFQTGATSRVRLVIEVTPPSGKEASMDLDEATVAVSHDYGVLATNMWTGQLPGWDNIVGRVPRLNRRVGNFVLRNGKILQGGKGLGSSPVFCRLARGVTIEQVEMYTDGMDTTTVDAERVEGPFTMRGCTLRHDVGLISNRLRSFSAVRLMNIQGPTTVEDNELRGVPQMGILLDGSTTGQPVRVLRNRIHMKAVTTNAYGITVAGSRNFEIAHNRVIAENGRGINIDSYRKDPVAFGDIHNNHVEVREGFNREYHTHNEARALRLRNTVDHQGRHHDLRIHHNTLIARTGPGLAQKAFAIRVSYLNPNDAMRRANIVLEDNHLLATTDSKDPAGRASALALDGVDSGVDIRFRDNIFESNDALLSLADTEGSVADYTLTGNTWRRSREGAERDVRLVHLGFWERTVKNVAIIGPRLEQEANRELTWAGTGEKEVALGVLADLVLMRGMQAVAETEVVIRDGSGTEIHRGTTDDKGRLPAVPLLTRRFRQVGTDFRKISASDAGPYTLELAGADAKKLSIEARDGEQTVQVTP